MYHTSIFVSTSELTKKRSGFRTPSAILVLTFSVPPITGGTDQSAIFDTGGGFNPECCCCNCCICYPCCCCCCFNSRRRVRVAAAAAVAVVVVVVAIATAIRTNFCLFRNYDNAVRHPMCERNGLVVPDCLVAIVIDVAIGIPGSSSSAINTYCTSILVSA